MIGIVGGGAFGTALAVTLARDGRPVTLWVREVAQRDALRQTRRNDRRLPGVDLPENVSVTSDIGDLSGSEAILLTVPMQALRGFLAGVGRGVGDGWIVACCKGVDLQTLSGPTALLTQAFPGTIPAVLSGPGFAVDIARGLPTALTLACADDVGAAAVQQMLSTAALRLYRTDDVIGVELGGALKNVVAIAAGIVMGAGLGESARAALMTRGYAEMARLALDLGARAETLAGLSGLGDLVLTCTSAQSRNFRFGLALGSGQGFDPTITVEGAATARAVSDLARGRGIDLPVTALVAALVEGRTDLPSAIQSLLSRPLKKE